jgi:hypothetical protein
VTGKNGKNGKERNKCSISFSIKIKKNLLQSKKKDK